MPFVEMSLNTGGRHGMDGVCEMAIPTGGGVGGGAFEAMGCL